VTAVLALGLALFVAKAGRPDTWLSARWDEFSNVHPTLTADVSHFGTGFSNRHDYWRVAWTTFKSHPVAGVGSGAFAVPWFRLRSLDENVNDAHSWQASALAETGIVGLALLAAVLLLPLAAARAARRGDGAWPIATVALGGAGVYFVLHASFDWLFRIPAIAIPGFLVLGALATGARIGPLAFVGSFQRTAVAAAALLAAVAVVPVSLSTREMNQAQDEAVASTEHAVHMLNRAAWLNPFAAAPLVVRAAVLQAEGRRAAAIDAAKEAVARNPEDWTTWAALARAEQAAHDRVAAGNALRRVRVLNPRARLAGTR